MLTNMTTEERERLAYAEGFTEAAEVLAALSDAENIATTLEDAQADAELYRQALQDIFDGVNAGTLTTGGCMMIAAQVLP